MKKSLSKKHIYLMRGGFEKKERKGGVKPFQGKKSVPEKKKNDPGKKKKGVDPGKTSTIVPDRGGENTRCGRGKQRGKILRTVDRLSGQDRAKSEKKSRLMGKR